MKIARAKRAKILFFIVKYANLRGSCCRRRGCLAGYSKFKKLRLQLQRKHYNITIELCVKLSLISCWSRCTK